jgi:hypothetical protein
MDTTAEHGTEGSQQALLKAARAVWGSGSMRAYLQTFAHGSREGHKLQPHFVGAGPYDELPTHGTVNAAVHGSNESCARLELPQAIFAASDDDEEDVQGFVPGEVVISYKEMVILLASDYRSVPTVCCGARITHAHTHKQTHTHAHAHTHTHTRTHTQTR